jgi:hypothetical protein
VFRLARAAFIGQADRMAKMSPRSLYEGLTRSKGAILAAAEDYCVRVIKSQTGKELANERGGAYLWRVTNSDRVRSAGSLIG